MEGRSERGCLTQELREDDTEFVVCYHDLPNGDRSPYHMCSCLCLVLAVLLGRISPSASRLRPVRVGAPLLGPQDTVFNYWLIFLMLPASLCPEP